jgi:hypothetical protein
MNTLAKFRLKIDKKISKIFIEKKKRKEKRRIEMNSNYLLVSLLIFTLFLRSNSNEDCDKDTAMDTSGEIQ